MTDEQPISEAFDLIRQYAVREGWIPIGFREWKVGPWAITVNGTSSERDGIPPWHARIVHDDIIAMMLIHPYGGVAGGWKDTEDEFVEAMKAELSEVRA